MRLLFKHFSALLVVALFHAVLLMPASLSNTGTRRPRSSAGPPCTMVFASGNYARAELAGWSLLNDPTIFALPHPDYGFSAMIHPALPFSYTPTPPAPDTVAIPPPQHLTVLSVPFRSEENGRSPELSLLSVRYFDDIPPVSAPRMPRRVLWSWGDGEPVTLAPAVDVDVVARTAAVGSFVRETIMEITIMAGRFRLKLAESSGNAALDDLAMATVGPLLAAQESQANTEWRLFGRRIAESSLRLRVDWMTALNPKEDSAGNGS